ncbi:hypothetical protein B1H10_00995 [candidate division KSB1 bacterium 4484_188]|nr:MAG: hypothetical protein B1H10_00995 [candidate division KSB1 bacterium 4484_188]
MKKLFALLIVTLVLGTMLFVGCRPPILEGAVVDIQQGQYESAFAKLQQAVQEYPNNPEAWYLLGTLYARKENFVKMNESFDKSLAIAQTYAKEIEQVRMTNFANNYNDALNSYYKKAREVDDPVTRKKMYAKAAEKFLKAHQANPERSEPLAPMSVSFLETGDTATAVKYMDKAIEMNPKKDTLMVTVGDFYTKINRMDKAVELYKKALTVNPDNTAAHLALGQVYAQQKLWDKAIEQFDISAKADPKNATIPENIAIIYYNNEKYAEAVPYLKKSLELDPSNKDMYEVLSLCYLQMAQKHIDKYTDTENMDEKAAADQIYKTALPFLEDAVKKFPDSALLWNNLGVCYAQEGMKEKAKAAFEKQKQLEGKQ